MTNEFKHYDGCKHNDPDNCSACALTDTRQDRPNYAAWPLAYMENGRAIPAKWRKAFFEEMTQTDNIPYAENIKATMAKRGVRFSDGHGLEIERGIVEPECECHLDKDGISLCTIHT